MIASASAALSATERSEGPEGWGPSMLREPVAEERAVARNRIAPELDLLALVEAGGDVVHRDLHRRVAVAGELARELDVELEPVALQVETVEALSSEHLEHRRHVGDPLLVQQVVGLGEQDLREVERQAADRRLVVLA